MASTNSTTCPAGSTILVTGSNGYIASHVVDQLILAGFKVKGTVRDEAKARYIEGVFHKRYTPNSFSAAIIPDITLPGATDSALQDCSGIIHLAQDMTMSPNFSDVFYPSVRGVQNLLESAALIPSIKRVVYTSATGAASTPKVGKRAHITKDSWNDALEAAQAEEPAGGYPFHHGMIVYWAAKAAAEKAAWSFVKEKNPGFVLNSVLTNMTVGPIIGDQPRGSGAFILGVYYSNPEAVAAMKNELFVPPQQMVDVRDTARLHVAALTEEDVKNERLLSASEEYNFNKVIEMMGTFAPEGHVLPEVDPKISRGLQTIDDARSVELLKRRGRDGWARVSDAVRENCLGEGN